MAEIIIMPKLGFNMSVGKLVTWYKKEGDMVTKGEPVFAVETDKTNIDIEATQDGVFRKKFIEEGDSVEVTLPIAIIADKNENINSLIEDCMSRLGKSTESAVKEEAPQLDKEEEQAKAKISPADGKVKITPRARIAASERGLDITTLNIIGTGYRGGICEKDILDYLANHQVKSTPLAKKLADSEGINIKDAAGTGVNGKVVKKDIEALMCKTASVPESDAELVNGKEVLEIADYTGVRKIIGDRLSQSFNASPHVFFTQKVNLQKLLDL